MTQTLSIISPDELRLPNSETNMLSTTDAKPLKTVTQTLSIINPDELRLPPLRPPESLDAPSKAAWQALAGLVDACTVTAANERHTIECVLALSVLALSVTRNKDVGYRCDYSASPFEACAVTAANERPTIECVSALSKQRCQIISSYPSILFEACAVIVANEYPTIESVPKICHALPPFSCVVEAYNP